MRRSAKAQIFCKLRASVPTEKPRRLGHAPPDRLVQAVRDNYVAIARRRRKGRLATDREAVLSGVLVLIAGMTGPTLQHDGRSLLAAGRRDPVGGPGTWSCEARQSAETENTRAPPRERALSFLATQTASPITFGRTWHLGQRSQDPRSDKDDSLAAKTQLLIAKGSRDASEKSIITFLACMYSRNPSKPRSRPPPLPR